MDIRDFILQNMPVGVAVIGSDLKVSYSNKKAESFLKRHELPDEVMGIARRVFRSEGEPPAGEIYIIKQLENSPNNWIFRVFVDYGETLRLVVFILEEAASNRIDIQSTRQKYGLTRRESDILRRVIDGLRNMEIADELDISEQTVKDYLSNIYRKIGVENRVSLLRHMFNADASAGN